MAQAPDAEEAQRVTEATFQLKQLGIATLTQAYEQPSAWPLFPVPCSYARRFTLTFYVPPSPASLALRIASARSTTCSLLKIVET